MSFGTGTMLYHEGKYYMVYGYHTERYKGAQEKVECRMDPKEKVFPLLSCEEILNAGKVPAGASFSVSDDGIHFEPAGVLYHPGRNPSTYAMPDGSVRVYAGYMGNGVWESEGFDKPFRLSKEDFSFIGSSVMKNSSECPSFFEWNGYKYLVIGFTGYYRTLSVDSAEYVDMAGKEEFYDGLCVPMITSFGENRRLIAGWLNGIGWGSVIIHRELLQEENGRLGMKWVPEMIPQTIGENLLPEPGTVNEEYSVLTRLEKDSSYLLELKVDPKAASCIKLQFADKEKAAELTLDLTGQRMQIMDTQAETEAEKLPTSYEFAAASNGAFDWHIPGQHIAYSSKNFCMADIFGMDEPFTLKVLIRSSKKMRSTVIDVEVAQRRTMVSVRPGLFADRILVAGDCSITENSLKKLKQIC